MFIRNIVDIETEWNLKDIVAALASRAREVDIETEWNLKYKEAFTDVKDMIGRYRNRVEFKVFEIQVYGVEAKL